MKRKKTTLVGGSGTHRRTETDYMGALLNTVTLDDWRDVVAGALQLAKNGDAPARAWLAQYLVGKPQAPAPTPLHVVVNQWSGADAVAAKLAEPLINRELYPLLHENDDWKEQVQHAVAIELAQRLPAPDAPAAPEQGERAMGKIAN